MTNVTPRHVTGSIKQGHFRCDVIAAGSSSVRSACVILVGALLFDITMGTSQGGVQGVTCPSPLAASAVALRYILDDESNLLEAGLAFAGWGEPGGRPVSCWGITLQPRITSRLEVRPRSEGRHRDGEGV